VTTTDRLAEACVDAEFDAIPTAVLTRLERHLLDWAGLVVAGREHAGSTRSLLDGVDALAAGEGPSTALATGERISPDRAALVNGTLAHSLDFDDTHRASSLHPGAPVISAAVAVAEAEGATIEELLTAIVLGYDVTCAMGRAVNPEAHYDRGFHITATCGTFGATAAVGHLLGLDSEETSAAFGVNGSQAAGSLQFLDNGAWNKRLHPGLAASRAVLAGTLAGSGFRGATRAIEGRHGFLASYTTDPDPEALTGIDPGGALLETAIKPYPCCRYIHAAIDALVEIGKEVDAEEVESVVVDLPRSGVALTGEPIEAKRSPENFVDCQFSTPFAAALVLSRADAGLRAFLDAQSRLDDPALVRLMEAVEVVTTDRTASRFPETWAADVAVETESERYERFVEHARGEPEKPLSREAVEAKFRELTKSAGVEKEAIETLLSACRSLRETDSETLFSALGGLGR
jgi:2-methylcitrate dehydratase PrpD